MQYKTDTFVERGELEVREWGRQYLACLRTVRVKLDLLGSKFSSCVHIVAQIDPAKGTLAQELPPTPIDGGTRSYKRTLGKSVLLCTFFMETLLVLQPIDHETSGLDSPMPSTITFLSTPSEADPEPWSVGV